MTLVVATGQWGRKSSSTSGRLGQGRTRVGEEKDNRAGLGSTCAEEEEKKKKWTGPTGGKERVRSSWPDLNFLFLILIIFLNFVIIIFF